MAPMKRRIFRAAVYLVFLFLVLTLLSSTIGRMSWPRVSVAAVTEGGLDRSIRFHTVVTAPREDTLSAGSDEDEGGPSDLVLGMRHGATLSMAYDELQLIDNYNITAKVTAYVPVSGSVSRAYYTSEGVKLTFVEFTYNPISGKFDAYFIVDPKKPIHAGYPLNITFRPKSDVEFTKIVPLGSVFYETTDFTRGYIYAITEEQTFWSKRHIVEKIEISVIARDHQYAAILFTDNRVPVPDQIASNPSRTLRSGSPVVLAGTS